MLYKKLFLLFSVIFFCTLVRGQQTNEQSLDSFSGKFIAAIRSHETQHTYLVTDKSVFATGESIWFNAFLLNTISQRISTKSSFLFVDLVNEKDSVVKLLVLDAANQQLNSRIVLPHSLPAGYYWLRAYTRKMSEGDTSGICIKPIYVADKNNNNSFSLPAVNAKNNSSNPIITFYPEGGSIITGVNSTVALRVTNKDGLPMVTNVIVKDSRDTIIANCTTNEYGLAKFDFEPSRYRKYKAVINWHGTEISYPLPPFNFYAGQIAVTKQPGGYKLRALLEDSVYKKDAVTYIIGISKDSLIFAGIGRGLYEVMVGNDKIPDGITTFYLFDKTFKILSERSVYAHNNNVNVKAATDKNVYTKRDKVTLNISITDAAQHLIPSLVSIAVIDTLTTAANEQCTFSGIALNEQTINNLLLSRNECLTDEEKDLLMYLRNNTYQTLSKTINKQESIDTDSLLYIRGTALTEKNNAPAANKVLMLISNLSNPVFYSDTTNDEGRFSFPLKNYTDSTEFAVQVQNLNRQPDNANIVIDNFNYPSLSTPVSLKQYLPLQTTTVKKIINTYYSDELINWNQKEQLTPVKVKAQKKPANYDESKRVSNFSSILTSEMLSEEKNVGDAILRVPGVHLSSGTIVIEAPISTNGYAEPLLIIDGAEGSSGGILSFLEGINPKDVDFIEVLRGAQAANYGARGANGVILVNTLSRKREANFSGDKANIKKFYEKGISNPVPFPVTDYQPKNSKTSTTTDTRSTLFWNGSYLSDDAHNNTITFYTGDIPATYKATITGVTIHGDIIYKTIIFQSK